MPEFLVEDEVRGTMTYRYKVIAKDKKEAMEKFQNDEWYEDMGSEFSADSFQDGKVIVHGMEN